MSKIKLSETQLLAFDMALGAAIRALVGGYKKIINSTDEELKKMKIDIDEEFKSVMDKIKSH